MIKTFRDLEVYKASYDLMLIVHRAVKNFPLYERNDLASQVRRASKSCPANIAEGWAKRRFEKEFKKHVKKLGGNAILAQRINTQAIVDKVIFVFMQGEAVLLKPAP